MISRRTISLLGFWSLAIAIPTSYSKGSAFEGRKLHSDGYIQENDPLSRWPVVFARTIDPSVTADQVPPSDEAG